MSLASHDSQSPARKRSRRATGIASADQVRAEPRFAPVRGRIYRKRLDSKAELPEAYQRFFVVSSRLVAGRPVLSVYSEHGPPAEGFTPVEADLEDAYFFHTAVAVRYQQQQAAAAQQQTVGTSR